MNQVSLGNENMLSRIRKLEELYHEVAPDSVMLIGDREPTAAECELGKELESLARECLNRE